MSKIYILTKFYNVLRISEKWICFVYYIFFYKFYIDNEYIVEKKFISWKVYKIAKNGLIKDLMFYNKNIL